MAFLCVSQQGELKTPKKLFGESPCRKTLAKKVEKHFLFHVVFFPSIFLIAFFG
jgi:hypothetical protein